MTINFQLINVKRQNALSFNRMDMMVGTKSARNASSHLSTKGSSTKTVLISTKTETAIATGVQPKLLPTTTMFLDFGVFVKITA